MENEILDTETPQIRFVSEVTHDLQTLKEVNRLYSLLHLGSILREALVSLILLILFGYLFCYVGDRAYYGRTVFVLALFYWGSFLFKLIRNRKGGESYKLMLQRNGGNPQHNRITFTDEGFEVENTCTGESSQYTYARVRGIARTDRFYLLYREMNHCTVVSKAALEGGSQEEFLEFLFGKCPLVPAWCFKKPTLGLALRWTGYGIWVLSFALAVYGQFF